MNQTFTFFQPDPPGSPANVQAPDAAIYTSPDDVLSDPDSTAAAKRAVLASWVSDARAVENAPTLRRLDSGAVVEVETILQALRSLDAADCDRTRAPAWPPPSRRRRSVISRLLNRVGPRGGSEDDDDDPPPAPASFGIPFRPTFVAAYGGGMAVSRGGESPNPPWRRLVADAR